MLYCINPVTVITTDTIDTILILYDCYSGVGYDNKLGKPNWPKLSWQISCSRENKFKKQKQYNNKKHVNFLQHLEGYFPYSS